MPKIRMCSKDVSNLMDELQHLGELLPELGVEGATMIFVMSDGSISGCFDLDENTRLKIDVENDGDKICREYVYV